MYRRPFLWRGENPPGAMDRLRFRHQAWRARLHRLRVYRFAHRQGTSGRRRCWVLRAAEGKHQPICEAVSVVARKFPWSRKDPHRDDPYWDFFINTPPADLTNTVTELIRNAPAGNVFPTPADIHTPEIMSHHVKEMARYFGAELVGITPLETNSTSNPDGYPFAVLCAIRAEYDPRVAPGIGGQVPVQNGLFITFVLSAWIRE